MKCRTCGGEMIARREAVTDHRIGLSKLILVNFPVLRCKNCKTREVVFPRLSELLRKIAETLIQKGDRLTGEEIKFLRKFLGWSSSDLAAQLGIALATISRWEHGKEKIGAVPDRLLRMLVAYGKHVENYDIETLQHIKMRTPRPAVLQARVKNEEYELVEK